MNLIIIIQYCTELHEEVGYTAISGFIFLRFFAPAILNPKLFSLRPENPVSHYMNMYMYYNVTCTCVVINCATRTQLSCLQISTCKYLYNSRY